MAEVCAVVLLAALTAYIVLAGADFGGGFWDLTAGGPERGGPVRGLVQRSMSPVWEANHVWLILLFTVFWTAFPDAFASVFSTLYIPLFVAAVGIIFRGAAFAFRGQAALIRSDSGLVFHPDGGFRMQQGTVLFRSSRRQESASHSDQKLASSLGVDAHSAREEETALREDLRDRKKKWRS